MTNQTKARIDGVRAVGIPVNDQDRALQFYVETLGFEKLMDAPLEEFGGRWIEVSPPQSTTTIALTPAR
jgi:lactoylglutathione lyase